MKKGTVWLDVDGVLLDYTRPFLSFLHSRDTALDITYDNLFDYDLGKICDVAKVMPEFHNSPEFGQLPMIVDPRWLWALKNAGLCVNVITKVPDSSPEMRLARLQNLTQAFGPVFDEIIVTGGECKLNYIALVTGTGNRAWLVEDNPYLLQDADGQGVPAYIKVLSVMHPYNKKELSEFKTIPVFDTTAQAMRQILLEVV